jgi:TetR/AcrR family transcriptional repressor of nem operon
VARANMREKILDAAVDCFHERGYNAAGVKDITDAAGVPKGSFYNHFESKEDTAIESLRRYSAAGRLNGLADESIPPLQRLRAHFERLRDETASYEYTRGCMFGNLGAEMADHSEPIRAAVGQAFQRWSGLIATAITQAQRDGLVDAGVDAQATARFILSAWEGALIYARVERSGAAFDAFFQTVFDSLLTAKV